MRGLLAAILLVIAVAISGCQNVHVEPIYIVQAHPIPAAAQGMNPEQVSQAIAQAAQANGWSVQRNGPDAIQAMQTWEDHAVIVSVTNDAQGFSIRNNGSIRLKEHDGLIHRQYNARVRALEAAIDKQLSQRP